MNEVPERNGHETKHFKDIPSAIDHVLEWFSGEEEEYASKEKFGYGRNLAHLRGQGVEPGSVWESQLTSYWSRGVILEKGLRNSGEDTIAARQYFAKHANAARALLSTVLARLSHDDYEPAKQTLRVEMALRGSEIAAGGLLFTNGADFEPNEFFTDTLCPIYDDIHEAVRGGAADDIAWEQASTLVSEGERLRSTVDPLRQYLMTSLDVLVAYVVSDGPLPQPGLPSGEVREWKAA